ncbi:PTS lactose/cellobiose transporter subunit IIA [Thaumasiovibrio sp. DFM-14]|uniref:PTS lactose/cellobiose transporter subunit IIA n=1 Tax=Thaumasiovibrio sp. DFM-14 TaxID=3384792 RepID=UPI0039A2DC33
MNVEISSQEDITEEFLMSLLCTAGEARSVIMEAMIQARNGDIDNANKMIAQADHLLVEVHRTQTSLIGFDEGKGKVSMTLILTHIQDHIMTAMLCRDLANEIIAIHDKLNQKG